MSKAPFSSSISQLFLKLRQYCRIAFHIASPREQLHLYGLAFFVNFEGRMSHGAWTRATFAPCHHH
jgi:hypothetical protein